MIGTKIVLMGNKLTLGHLNLIGPDLHQHVRVAFSFPDTVTLSFQALEVRTKLLQMFFTHFGLDIIGDWSTVCW